MTSNFNNILTPTISTKEMFSTTTSNLDIIPFNKNNYDFYTLNLDYNYLTRIININSIGSVIFPADVNIVHLGLVYPNNNDSDSLLRQNNTQLKSIIIPTTVKFIGQIAFKGASKLTDVIFSSPSTIASISDSAFHSTNIINITIPSSVIYIGPQCFSMCRKLTSLTFEAKSRLKIIPKEFAFCSNLSRIIIPESVTQIDDYAFAQMKVGTNGNILTGVLSTIKDIIFEGNKPIIAPNAFYGINNLRIYYYPDKTGWDEPMPNYNDKNVKYFISLSKNIVNIPISLTDYDFYIESKSNYNNFLYLQYPYSITVSKIIKIPLSGYIFIPSDIVNGKIVTQFGNLVGYKNDRDCMLEINIRNLVKSIVIPETVNHIGRIAFHEATNLTSFEIISPSSLKNISERAFTKSGLNNIIIPNSVETIGSNCFDLCKNLTSIVFQKTSKLKIIPNNFASLTSLTSITIPASVLQIGEYAFAQISLDINGEISQKVPSTIKEIIFEGNKPNIASTAFYGIDNLKIYYNSEAVGWTEPMNNKNNINMPYKIEQIIKIPVIPVIPAIIKDGNGFEYKLMFNDTQYWINKYTGTSNEINNIPSVFNNLPVSGISDFVFANSKITSIYIPDTIKFIGKSAFKDTTDLTSIFINNSSQLEKIDTYAFDNSRITNINIPNNVTAIDDYAFLNCLYLYTIYFQGNINSITFGINVFLNIKINFMYRGRDRVAFCNLKSITNPKVVNNKIEDIVLKDFIYLNKDLLSLNLSGKLINGFYNKIIDTTIPPTTDMYWDNFLRHSVYSGGNLYYRTDNGWIDGLNINKKYRVDVIINIRNLDAKDITWECRLLKIIKNNQELQAGIKEFIPSIKSMAYQTDENVPITMKLSGVITDCTTFTIINKRILKNRNIPIPNIKESTNNINLSLSIFEIL